MLVATESRYLNEEEVAYILKLTEDDITKKNLIKWFAIQKTIKPMFSPQDKFRLPKGKLHNSEEILTTVGRYLFNLFIINPFQGKLPYVNDPINKGKLKDIEANIAQMTLDEEIPVKWFIDYLNRIQWFGYVAVDFLTPGMSLGVIMPNPIIKKRKAELIKQNKAAIEAGDPNIATEMETELCKLANEVLKDDYAYDLYASKASKSSIGTHYKAFNIMKGAVLNNSNGKYNVCTSDYMSGVSTDDYAAFADTLVYAAHSRAIGTQKGGYITKQMFAAFQSVVLDDKGSDCHATKTLDIILTKENYKLFLYRYIVENGKLVRLDNTNIKSYIGKLVHFRSVLYCQGEKLCNKCAGDLYYNLGIQNVGLTVTKVGSAVLNLSLKSFHDTTLHLQKINFRDYID